MWQPMVEIVDETKRPRNGLHRGYAIIHLGTNGSRTTLAELPIKIPHVSTVVSI